MQSLSFDFVDVKFKYRAGIEEYPFCDYVAKFKWKRFNKSDRYPISKNTWNDQGTRQQYYYKLG